VGAGNLGSALALSLRAAGYVVSEIVSRKESSRRARGLARRVGARATIIRKPEITAEVVWLCVPDGAIASSARALARGVSWKDRIALHSSGALGSDEIAVLRRRGAKVASAHPFMTFVARVTPSLAGVGFAVEGDPAAARAARQMVMALGGKVHPIRKQDKAAYHAWSTFVSPLLTALVALSERVAQAAGVSRAQARLRMLPILRQTVENYALQGAARGFSGPIVRGDVATVRHHLKVLRAIPAAREVYVALARSAIRTLPTRNHRQLLKILR
jgi:predicted short-subunit dehydrogenase-like oxidoreductase (DUF2520 family)